MAKDTVYKMRKKDNPEEFYENGRIFTRINHARCSLSQSRGGWKHYGRGGGKLNPADWEIVTYQLVPVEGGTIDV